MAARSMRSIKNSKLPSSGANSLSLNSPWLNFEAGALSKSLDISRISPFLLGLRQAELTGPLAQFQATLPQVDDAVRLVKSMNLVTELRGSW